MIYQQIIFNNEEETKNFIQLFAKRLKPTDIVLFSGDLGSGKTFFCREIIKYFCGNDTKVTSPTFNILQTYQTTKFAIYHFDLYRLKSVEEVYELGLEEALNGNLCLIEWAQLIEHILPKSIIKVELYIMESNKRLCIVKF